uniref:Major facilitator superfamily (MFS) profile domain-containing protein n=1 Tax=Kalanchoe fedtschenkoi TaxID=63787 RepID=A0A7N0UIZ3_KALFE
MMRGAVLVALAAAVGNMLQGWDNSTIAGSVLYIKKEFHLETEPTIEGLIIAMSLIGGTLITTCSGAVSDAVGRRPMLILSSILYFVSGLVMLCAPNVYVLLLGRLLDGFGVGLAVTLVPVYISETAPSEVRGQLNTFPQLMGSSGMFLSYCMVFGMSLMEAPSWRLMLGLLSFPSFLFFLLAWLFLPESPRWLVSKGRMVEAKEVLQRLRGREDVSGELALLVEGLGVGGETTIEEYIIGPANDLADDIFHPSEKKDEITLLGPEERVSWVAKPVTRQGTYGIASRAGSMANSHSVPLMDPLVNLFGSVHEANPEMRGSMLSTLLPNFGSMFNDADHVKNDQWDEESQADGDDYSPSATAEGADFDDNVNSPLLTRQTTSMDKDPADPSCGSMRRGSIIGGGEGSAGIGGGWQLAWKKTEKIGKDGKREEVLQRVYLHEDGAVGSRRGSIVSLSRGGSIAGDGDEVIQAAALVSRSVLCTKDPGAHPLQQAMQPAAVATKGLTWRDLLEPGVKHALIVGIGLQILQQLAGINGVLYYTPQILKQAGVDVLLANLGIGSDSASLLISCLTTLMMLPCIIVAMRLMDISGRRFLMLATIPVLVVSLLAMVVVSVIDFGSVVHAAVSTVGVVVYLSCFVMGFGAIPNILCSEIFPTRVRGICIAITALTYWLGNIMITYSLPAMLNSLGLAGVFSIYALACVMSWIFIYLKVPETKGMPLEVISEFFAMDMFIDDK